MIRFTGTLSFEADDFSKLFYLDLNSNYFFGSIPSTIESLSKSLKYFYVNSNLLSGSIPEELSELTSLCECYLNNNFLVGSLPGDIGNLKDLQIFLAHDNHLAGQIPSSLSRMQNLRYLFFQSNYFTGPISSVFNSSLQRQVVAVDFSSNLLSGPLSANIFSLPSLQSFAAERNCFTGSLPSEICNAQSLTFLSLDGMNTAANCIKYLFPAFTGISTYIRTSDIVGGLPRCLFSMPNLQTLDLCGIGFTDSFPADLVVSPSLTDLSLSNNKMTGFVPNSIQERTWNHLDLSYNQLSGTLSKNFAEYTSSSSLLLNVNRFSGYIPKSLRYVQNISILDGNLFYCDSNRYPLPVNDPNYFIYTCASNSLDTSLIVWSAFFFCALAFTLLLFASVWTFDYWKKADIIFHGRLLALKIIHWLSVFGNSSRELSDCRNIRQLAFFNQQLRVFTFYVTLLIVFAVMPAYIAVTIFSYNHLTYEYTFFVSMAFISGQSAAYVLLAILVTFLAAVLWLLNREILATFSSLRIAPSRFTIAESLKENSPSRRHLSHICALTAVFIINFLVVVPFDCLYIYATISLSTIYVDASQVALALFKIVWIDFAITEILHRVLRHYHPSRATNLAVRMQLSRTHVESRMESRHMVFQMFLILLNNIGFPCLAILFISPNCFRDAIFASASINTSYSYADCESFFLQSDGTTVCVDGSVQTVSTTFIPPFQYSYQCSSMFITNFINIYFYMFVMVGFITPTLKIAAKMLHSYLYSSSKSDLPSKKEKTRFRKVLEFIVPPMLMPIYDEIPAELPILFDRNKFLVRTATFVSILLTYGLVFGPLAVVIFISICIHTIFEQIMVGRLIIIENERGLRRPYSYRQIIDKEAEGIAESTTMMVWAIWPFISLFYGFFIFDTQGSEVGWERSLLAAFVMVLTPLILWTIVQIYNIFLSQKILIMEHENPDSLVVRFFTAVFVRDRTVESDDQRGSEVEEAHENGAVNRELILIDAESRSKSLVLNPLYRSSS